MIFKVFLAVNHHVNTDYISDLSLKLISILHNEFIILNTLQILIFKVYTTDNYVVNSSQYVYITAAEEKLAALNALKMFCERKSEKINYLAVLWMIFTSLTVTDVDLNFLKTYIKKINANVLYIFLYFLLHTMIQKDTQIFIMLICNKSDDCIMNAWMLAENKDKLIMKTTVMMWFI